MLYEVLAGAKVMVIDKDTILLVKRARDPSKGTWDFPGGLLEKGETLEQCAIREVKEETGLDVDIQELLDAIHAIPDRTDFKDVIILYYKAKLSGGTMKLDNESSDAKWVTIDELKSLDNIRPKLREFLKRQGV